jgi:very-short-patch-repair endonuclease
MSLNYKASLREIAKIVSRDLRKDSTETEKIFWNIVRNRKFYNKKFHRHYPIFYEITGKESFFVADFYCFQERLVIELYGKYHKYRFKVDKDRAKILNYLGLLIIRFNNKEILEDIDKVLETIKNNF